MSDKAFIDTNVLIYAVDQSPAEIARAARARELLRQNNLCLSTQVLGEFYRAVTHARRASPLTHTEAVSWVQLWKRYEVATVTVAHVDLALEVRQRFQVDYFDALILAAAHLAGCETLYSEDLAAGQDYDGVRVCNPFAPIKPDP
ncbi:MAG: PIN domain-containing protein [Verrucomicrobiota bacterium]